MEIKTLNEETIKDLKAKKNTNDNFQLNPQEREYLKEKGLKEFDDFKTDINDFKKSFKKLFCGDSLLNVPQIEFFFMYADTLFSEFLPSILEKDYEKFYHMNLAVNNEVKLKDFEDMEKYFYQMLKEKYHN